MFSSKFVSFKSYEKKSFIYYFSQQLFRHYYQYLVLKMIKILLNLVMLLSILYLYILFKDIHRPSISKHQKHLPFNDFRSKHTQLTKK